MKPLAQRLQRVILALLGIYLFVYPFGMLLLIFDMVPDWGVWMGGALLILQGSMMALWLTAIYGQRGLLATVLILVMSWAVEHIGVITGFPFGTYHYTDVLLPKLAGVVPLAIPFAWLLVVPTSVGVIEHLIQRRQPAPQPSATNYWYSLSPRSGSKVPFGASEHRSMYSYVRLSIDRCTATYV
ncbi:MAG: carotenoid biosynthesis protein [Chloroflexaceae bacterium]|nr:carotenoid biosynthesis protein [Chloroflexaceae bacterium]